MRQSNSLLLILFLGGLQYSGATECESPINEEKWNKLFPERWGVGAYWKQIYTALDIYYPAMAVDYYSYENLKRAVAMLKPIKLKQNASNSAISVYRMNSQDANPQWKFLYSYGWGTIDQTIDFSHFANKPGASRVEKLRELAAFLGNLAHETGEGDKGLFYREEIFFERYPSWGSPGHYYRDESSVSFVPSNKPTYFPVGSKRQGQQRFYTTSYHGRGPLQLSWNYNYGQLSAVMFGDVRKLLDNPDILLEDGAYGLMSAIWFWMFPQPPKPSCHEVMYQSTSPVTPWGFGRSIIIINGGHEGGATENGSSDADLKVTRRIKNYRRIAESFNISVGINGEQLDTRGMWAY